jgi:hypothetical protein
MCVPLLVPNPPSSLILHLSVILGLDPRTHLFGEIISSAGIRDFDEENGSSSGLTRGVRMTEGGK